MKRKASEKLLKTAEEEPQIASLVTPIISDGDLQLDFTKDLAQPLGLLVSRHTLCLSSPVFKAMFHDNSRWYKSVNKTLNTDGVQVFRLEDDYYAPMEIIMNIIHLQGHKVPPVLLFPQLELCACLCDKYDLGRSLGGWPGIWMKSYLRRVETPGFERWLYISSIFKRHDIFTTVTRHMVLNTTLSDTGELLYQRSTLWAEGVATSTLAWIAETRAGVVDKLLQFCWVARQNACRLRDPYGTDSEVEDCEAHPEVEVCEAVNLGCLSRQFPSLCEPTETSKSDPRSVTEIHDAISKIRHLKGMSGLTLHFENRHGPCDVGHFIMRKAGACISAVQGQKMRSTRVRPALPIWVDNMLTDLRSSHPSARLQGVMGNAVVSSLTNTAVHMVATTEYPADSAKVTLPLVRCLDCTEEGWIIPGPEMMDSQFEEHLKSHQHLDRVEKGLDAANEEARRRLVEEGRSLTEERPA